MERREKKRTSNASLNPKMEPRGDLVATYLPPLAERREDLQSKKVRFYKDGDKNFGGVDVCVSNQRYRSLDALIEDLNGCVKLPRGVRTISTPGGRNTVRDIQELQHGRSYVCSSSARIKKMDYNSARNPSWAPFSKSSRDKRLGDQLNNSFSNLSKSMSLASNSCLRKSSCPALSSPCLPRKRQTSKGRRLTLNLVSQWIDGPVEFLYNRSSQVEWDTLLRDMARAAKVPRGSVPQLIAATSGKKIESISQLVNCNCSSLLVVAFMDSSEKELTEPEQWQKSTSSPRTTPTRPPLPRPEVTGKSTPEYPQVPSDVNNGGQDGDEETSKEMDVVEEPSLTDEKTAEDDSNSELQPKSGDFDNVKISKAENHIDDKEDVEESHDEDKTASVEGEPAIDDRHSRSRPQSGDIGDVGKSEADRIGDEKVVVNGHNGDRTTIEDRPPNDGPVISDECDQSAKLGKDNSKEGENCPTCRNRCLLIKEPQEGEFNENREHSTIHEIAVSSKEDKTSKAVEQSHSDNQDVIEKQKIEWAGIGTPINSSPIHFLGQRERSSSFLSETSESSLSLTCAAALRPGAFHMSTVRPASPTSSLLAYPTPYVIKMKMDLPVDFEDLVFSQSDKKGGTPSDKGPDSREACLQSQVKDDSWNSLSDTKDTESSASIIKKLTLQDTYAPGPTISRGAYASVRECTHKKTNKKYLLKSISRRKIYAHEDVVKNELAIMKLLNHPNIVKLEEEFEDDEYHHCVLEYIHGGDLYFAILECHHFCESDVAVVMWSLGHALMYLHNHKIVHRGISAESLFVVVNPNGSQTIKLGNFSTAITVSQPLSVICGSVPYIAPEMLLGTGYGTKVDLWASGVLCYIMLCGVSPFNTSSEDKDNFVKSVSSKHIVVEKIRNCQYDFQSKIWNSVSDPAKELISELLVSSPRTRLSAEDMLRHSWLRSTKDSVEEGSILNRSGRKSGMKHGFAITALDKIVKDPNRTYHISASDGGRQLLGN